MIKYVYYKTMRFQEKISRYFLMLSFLFVLLYGFFFSIMISLRRQSRCNNMNLHCVIFHYQEDKIASLIWGIESLWCTDTAATVVYTFESARDWKFIFSSLKERILFDSNTKFYYLWVNGCQILLSVLHILHEWCSMFKYVIIVF